MLGTLHNKLLPGCSDPRRIACQLRWYVFPEKSASEQKNTRENEARSYGQIHQQRNLCSSIQLAASNCEKTKNAISLETTSCFTYDNIRYRLCGGKEHWCGRARKLSISLRKGIQSLEEALHSGRPSCRIGSSVIYGCESDLQVSAEFCAALIILH